eukprot:gene21353-27663_t
MNINQQNKDIKAWKSGEVFIKRTDSSNFNEQSNSNNHHSNNRQRSGRKSNDPWWMREDEENNPRMRPSYKSWWVIRNFYVDSSWKLVQLKEESTRRGLSTSGKKDELIERINTSTKLYDLSDENFTKPIFYSDNITDFPPCYPETYEKVTN